MPLSEVLESVDSAQDRQERDLAALAESIVSQAARQPAALRVSIDDAVRAAVRDQNAGASELREARLRLEALLDRAAAMARTARFVLGGVRSAAAASMARVDTAERELEELRAYLAGRWPTASREEVARMIARGEFADAEEALAADRGLTKEQMRDRLEEHRQRRQALGME